jgi:hypothetical protein
VNEAEILEAMMGSQSLATEAMVLYLSIVSGYLIAAFMAGERLTGYQVFVVSVFFTVFASFATWGSISYFFWASMFLEQSSVLDGGMTESLVKPFQLIGFMEVLGIFASLYFMRAIRHPKE